MFKFLKDKLKGVISGISKSIEKEEEPAEEIKKEIIEQPGKEKKSPKPKAKKEKQPLDYNAIPEAPELIEEKAVEKEAEEMEKGTKEAAEAIEEKEAESKGIFQRIKEAFIPEQGKSIADAIKEKITTKKISKEKFHELFWEMEILMLENNVALEVVDKIKKDLEEAVVEKPLPRGRVAEAIREALQKSIESLFEAEKPRILEKIKGKKPYVILFLGINGSGKTTTIAKFASMLMAHKLKVVMAASDTFRAASIEQLQQHADKLGVKLIKHNYGSDPAAVAFDAIKFAESKGIDAVLIDTAGRLHSNANLMQEMQKIVRVAKPDLKVFVGESITGNDCVEQARTFNEAIGIDGIILSKADVDEKGGAAISVSYVTKKPILYLGVGQDYNDLKEFEPKIVIEGLGL